MMRTIADLLMILSCWEAIRKLAIRIWGLTMPFTAPKFVNSVDYWFNPRTPNSGAPDNTNQPCQIYQWSKQANMWLDSTTGHEVPIIILRLPSAPSVIPQPGDILGKVAALPSQDELFLVLFRSRMHSGFPNTYLRFDCVRCTRAGAVVVQPRP